MNTKQIKYVLALAREGSFSRAAELLGISQPSLSQYIKKIEKEAGIELFDRTGGDVRITDAGRVYVEDGRKILELEHHMEEMFSDITEYRSGSVIIGASPFRAAAMLPEVAAAFRERWPGIRLVVREGTTSELLDGLEHGEYDLALTLLPEEAVPFDTEHVTEEELILAVPASMPRIPSTVLTGRKYPAVDAAVLDGREMILLTETQFMTKLLLRLAEEYGLSFRTAAQVKSLEAQIAMVRAGLGCALTASGIERFCSPGEVRFYSFAQALPKRQVVILKQKGKNLAKPAEDLVRVIRSIEW